MKVLFLSMHRPDRSPGQRFRFEQYLPYLRSQGLECDHSWLLNDADDKVFYGRGSLLPKVRVGLKALSIRVRNVISNALGRYDVVFVAREAMFAGPPLFEELFALSNSRMVFDFDDSIWIPAISEANKAFAPLKFTNKIDRILRLSTKVFAGNDYLADYARKFSSDVNIVPTTIDTDEYVPRSGVRTGGPVCVGWSGSFSTVQHFKVSLPVLKRIRGKYGDRVTFKVIGDASYREPDLQLVGDAWKLETEIDDLRRIDIGLMPLPDDEWSRGKCGLKGLQYMALGIPTLMSPVGVNCEILTDGESGFLPKSEDEWFERLSTLIEQPKLRHKLGHAGREVVVERYSLAAWRERYRDLLLATAAD